MKNRKLQTTINEHIQDVNKNRPATNLCRLFQTNNI